MRLRMVLLIKSDARSPFSVAATSGDTKIDDFSGMGLACKTELKLRPSLGAIEYNRGNGMCYFSWVGVPAD